MHKMRIKGYQMCGQEMYWRKSTSKYSKNGTRQTRRGEAKGNKERWEEATRWLVQVW